MLTFNVESHGPRPNEESGNQNAVLELLLSFRVGFFSPLFLALLLGFAVQHGSSSLQIAKDHASLLVTVGHAVGNYSRQ